MATIAYDMLLDGSIRNAFMHNIHVFNAVSKSALLGGLPVHWSELSLAPLVGIAYVVFSWNATLLWNKPFGPHQFIYFFFDTTVPGYGASIALLALLFALILFFVLFCTSELLLHCGLTVAWPRALALSGFCVPSS